MAKFYATAEIKADDFTSYDCSERSAPLDVKEIRKKAISLLGGINPCVGAAIKLNIHGMKIKADDFFTVGGNTTLMSTFLETLKKQEGYKGDVTSQGKESSKKIVTPLRVARCFASETILLLKSGKIELPSDLEEIAKDTGLPAHFSFLAAPYGMSDADLKDNMEPLMMFAANFDRVIKEAHAKKYLEGTSKRSHLDAVTNYLQWRGIAK